MPGTQHLLDRIPPATTTAGTVVGAIPQVQSDERIQWGPAALDQVEGYVPRVQPDGSVDWEYPLGTPAAAIADTDDVAANQTAAINAILAVLRAKQVIAP